MGTRAYVIDRLTAPAFPLPYAPLEQQLRHLLAQQAAMEEKLAAQRVYMQHIAGGFTFLRAWATRAAQGTVSLHDLLLLTTYGAPQTNAETKSVYERFIRSRLVEESAPPPDSATQFHSLSANSLYLLLTHLAALLTCEAAEEGKRRVLRFLELSARDFPEVLMESPLRAEMAQKLAQWREGLSVGELRDRIARLEAQMRRRLEEQ